MSICTYVEVYNAVVLYREVCHFKPLIFHCTTRVQNTLVFLGMRIPYEAALLTSFLSPNPSLLLLSFLPLSLPPPLPSPPLLLSLPPLFLLPPSFLPPPSLLPSLLSSSSLPPFFLLPSLPPSSTPPPSLLYSSSLPSLPILSLLSSLWPPPSPRIIMPFTPHIAQDDRKKKNNKQRTKPFLQYS